jgi:hypothetical protein
MIPLGQVPSTSGSIEPNDPTTSGWIIPSLIRSRSAQATIFGKIQSVMRHIISIAALCLLLLQTTALHAQADAGPDQWTCLDTVSMQATATSAGNTAFWSLSSGFATIVNPSDPLTLVTDIWIGTNVLTWTVITPMDTTTDDVNIYRVEFDPGIANAGPDQVVLAPPYTTNLNANQPIFPQVCTWTVVQGMGDISNPNNPFSEVTSLGLGENIFQWTCDDGPCSTFVNADQVMISVELGTSVAMVGNGDPMTLWFDNAAGLLRMAGNTQYRSLSIVNAMGQQVPVGSDRTGATVDVSSLSPGVYAAIAIIGGERMTLRFVVGH